MWILEIEEVHRFIHRSTSWSKFIFSTVVVFWYVALFACSWLVCCVAIVNLNMSMGRQIEHNSNTQNPNGAGDGTKPCS